MAVLYNAFINTARLVICVAKTGRVQKDQPRNGMSGIELDV